MSYFAPIASSKAATVATPSAERNAMDEDIQIISDVLAGLPAMRARAAIYLPRYAAEDHDEWRRRVDAAPWRAEFRDGLRTLASKPFAKPLTLPADAPLAMWRFPADVDGAGNSLHVFARRAFEQAVAFGSALIFVDSPSKPEWVRTVADEKAWGLQWPFWHVLTPQHVIACHFGPGKRQIEHRRYWSCAVEREGWGEREVRQIVVLERGKWEIWREVVGLNGQKEWSLHDSGATGLDFIPVVPVFLGERLGDLRARPPLLDLAQMQLELFARFSALKKC